MLGLLRELLSPGTVEAPDPQAQERLAIALLLAEMARANFQVQAAERDKIAELLARRYSLQPEQARQLTERALARADDATSLFDYIRTVNQRLDYPARCRLMELLWQVAYADGELDPLEEQRLRKLAGLLYVDDADFVRTKLKVLETVSHPRPASS